jgi:deoxyribonuclease V
MDPVDFPGDRAALAALQDALRAAAPPPWTPTPGGPFVVGACFVTFPRGQAGAGAAGDAGHAGAALARVGRVGSAVVLATAVVAAPAGAPYAAGFLAAREGPLLAAAVQALPARPDVLIVNATGRDHPRRAGLAVHLGAALDLPTVGVTHRPLFAAGDWPPDVDGASAPLLLDGEEVGRWLRPRAGLRPLAVHAGWRTTPAVAVAVVQRVLGRARTPLPLRAAREAARRARAAAES